MSWPPYSAGARMHTSDAPPTRKSISALGDVNPAGPHHRLTYAGSLQAFHTSSTGASKMRLTTTSNVWVFSLVSSPFTVANPFLLVNLARERPAGDIVERTGDGAGLLRGQEGRRGPPARRLATPTPSRPLSSWDLLRPPSSAGSAQSIRQYS